MRKLFFFLIVLFLIPSSVYPINPLRVTPVVKAVKKAASAVVNIQASKVIEKEISPFEDFFGPSDLFPFFKDFFPSYKRKFIERSIGSGFIVDGKKRIMLTNAHVIAGASNIKIKLLDGRKFKATLIGSDPDFDIAVLKIKGEGALPQVKMGTSKNLMIGETVIAIGNPFGFSHTVTTGVVSAINRSIQTEEGFFTGLIQTDAAINPGNSGGPLLNILGEVIGINTAIYSGAQGIGFAIPIDKAKYVMREITLHGKVQPVWLGIFVQNVDQNIANYFNLDEIKGILVTDVIKGSPAQKKGIIPGDLILTLNGIDIRSKEQYVQILRNLTSNSPVYLTLIHKGVKRHLSLLPAPLTLNKVLNLAYKRWGFWVKSQGNFLIVKKVLASSPAKRLGLREGDLIYRIGGVRTKKLSDFYNAFVRYRMRNSIILLVVRANRGYYVKLRIF